MIPPDPKIALEEKRKAEHDRELAEEQLQKKRRDELLAKQDKQRKMDEKIRQVAEKRRDSDAKKRMLRAKELEFRTMSAETDRLKIALRADEEGANHVAGEAQYRVDAVERDINRTLMTKKYRIEFLEKEISRMQLDIESKNHEIEKLRQEMQIAERQMSHETGRVLGHAGLRIDEVKIHREKTQIGEKEFRLQQMNQEIINLKRDIKKDDDDLRTLENELRLLR